MFTNAGAAFESYNPEFLAVCVQIKLLLLPPNNIAYVIEQKFNQVLHMQSNYSDCIIAISGALQLKLISLQPAVKQLTENH